MVTTLNITLDDDVADRAREVKDGHGLTWPEFVDEATAALADQQEAADEQDRREPRHEPEERYNDELDLDSVEIDVPGSGPIEERRKETIIKMAELLRDRGSAEKSDFLELVDSDHVEYASATSFWSNAVKGRDSLGAIPGVRKPSEGRTEWMWMGE